MPEQKSIEERLVLILGASGDLGFNLSLRLAQEGYRKFILQCCNNIERLALLAETLQAQGAECHLVACDFRRMDVAWDHLVEILDSLPPVDVLINFQGLSHSDLVQDVHFATWNDLVSVNLASCFRAIQLVSRGMLRQHSGVILNCTSIWGMKGAALEVPYASLKAGIIGLTRSLAKEWGPSGIRVNAIAPGWIQGQMNRNYSETEASDFASDVPLGRLGTPDDVAEAASFLISERASYITGQVLAVDGGYTT